MAILFLLPPIALPATFDVNNYGAIGDGKTDDSQAFLRAWAAVCKDASATPSVLNIGFKTFLINAVLNFMGPCKPSSITVQITGVLVAPGDLRTWRGNNENWLIFSSVNGLTLAGTGIIDGKGQAWWDKCRSGCILGPAQVLMNGCNNLVVKGLKLVNSQRSHLAITNCNDVLLSQLTITSPGDSPNTDGIDVSNSRRIRIEWSTIATGDDCIAINRGTYQINITGIACGPGHGISIGSLGKDKSSSEEVTDVIMRQCNFTRTTNGARIKTWQGGVGFASRIIFEDINFISTRNPIIIDQTYYDMPYGYYKNVLGAVKVTGVTYQRMHGTSPDPVAVTLTCSPLAPCSGIVMKEVMIRRDDGGATSSSCSNAFGSIGKECEPKVNCLTTTS
ncbi:probable polygalacturonase At3g15720 [Zingiber officinale]|uniref:probable polygalacturonase At3g15720 n=1 Tax=Zingiber officinale TaxID=94328 RepID=UPI001C4AE52B|nr:probable polygalacturonase At3g15720 [Zingiber officinale]